MANKAGGKLRKDLASPGYSQIGKNSGDGFPKSRGEDNFSETTEMEQWSVSACYCFWHLGLAPAASRLSGILVLAMIQLLLILRAYRKQIFRELIGLKLWVDD